MREIETHKTNALNQRILVYAVDEPGPGGACHHYRVTDGAHVISDIYFQKGGLQEVGVVNGGTHEALIAILIDRLQAFQAGPFSCRENAIVLTNLQESMMWLRERSEKRLARGVEGKHVK